MEITEEQEEELRVIFQVGVKSWKLSHDSDSDSDEEKERFERRDVIHETQLPELLQMLGILADEESVWKVIRTFKNPNRSRTLTFEAFKAFMQVFYEQNDSKEEITHAFVAIKGESERIDPQRLLQFFISRGESTVSLEDCQRIVDLVGKDGSISFDHFTKHMNESCL